MIFCYCHIMYLNDVHLAVSVPSLHYYHGSFDYLAVI
jgi:hypothetical protein